MKFIFNISVTVVTAVLEVQEFLNKYSLYYILHLDKTTLTIRMYSKSIGQDSS